MTQKKKFFSDDNYTPDNLSDDNDNVNDNDNDDCPVELDLLKLIAMSTIAEMGITAEEYADFLNGGYDTEQLKKQMLSMRLSQLQSEAASDLGGNSQSTERPHSLAATPDPMPDADKKSLRIKVQMKNVTKPPMWRELIIPADFNFSQLHYAIQYVTNFTNRHLWQFQRRAHCHDLLIGIPFGGDGYGLEEWTHNASETPVTSFLSKKGDKLEYVYDFDDNWVFTVSVLEVMDRHGEVAELSGWKCDIQPVEDCGIYYYIQLREVAASFDTLNEKDKARAAGKLELPNTKILELCIQDYTIETEYIQKRLSEISDRYCR